MKIKDKIFISSVISLFIFSGVACVKIETGPETEEQRTETSELRAKDFRINWANRFSQASGFNKAVQLKALIDSVSVNYLNYGDRVADQWREGNTGRGQLVPDTEMREVVTAWNKSEEPLLDAYEEVVEYSINNIKDSGFFELPVIESFQENIKLFYEIRSGVFYPSGTVDDYEYLLEQLKSRRNVLSTNLDNELSRFHK